MLRPIGGTISGGGKLLKSDLYIGNWYYNRYKAGVRSKRNTWDRSEWIKVSVPPLVSQEIWDAAQKQMAENTRKASRNTKNEYLLKGLLVCADCGFGVSAFTKNNGYRYYAYYRCLGQLKHNSLDYTSQTCHRSLRRDDVDHRVWERIKAILQNPELILVSLRRRQAEAEQETELIRERLRNVERRIEGLGEQQARLLDLFLAEDSSLPKNLLEQKMAEIAQQQSAFEGEAKDLRSRLEQGAISDETVEHVRRYCELAQQGIEAFTFEDKRAALEALNIRGILKRGATPAEDTIILTGYVTIPNSEAGSETCPIAPTPSL